MGTRRRGFVRFSDGLGADGKHAAAGLLFCGPRVFFSWHALFCARIRLGLEFEVGEHSSFLALAAFLIFHSLRKEPEGFSLCTYPIAYPIAG
jgi:hypothetical protein